MRFYRAITGKDLPPMGRLKLGMLRDRRPKIPLSSALDEAKKRLQFKEAQSESQVLRCEQTGSTEPALHNN
jgi:hypothetical protein